jgi:peroxiredoxin
MALAAGSKAPDFTLKTKRGGDPKDVKLSENFGKKKTVLLFFPLAFTGVCTKEMCDVSAGLASYEKLDAAVYGISVDSPFAQEAQQGSQQSLWNVVARPDRFGLGQRPRRFCHR